MWFSSLLRKRQRIAPSACGRGSHRRGGKFQTCSTTNSFRPRLEALEDRWLPSQVSLTVSSLADSGPGTLRAAILAADAGSQKDQFMIGFAVTGTIDLQTRLPDLNNNITIQGPGASSLTVEQAPGMTFPSNNWPIFNTNATLFQISISELTMANSEAGIVNGSSMTVTNCAFLNNHLQAGYAGGAIYNFSWGTLTVSGCTISGNSATDGGGIFNGGAMTITASTIISGNSATAQGGGIWNGGSSGMTISGSTISGNSAIYGGGIYNAGPLTVADSSTISGNSATFGGGGIYNQNYRSVTVRDSVLTGNSATDGGAIYNVPGATLDVRGSIFTGNTASDSGGGIYNLGTATLQQSSLSGNSAPNDGGGIFNGTSGTLTVKDSTVTGNAAPAGADLYNLGALTLDDSTVGVIGP
jgi:predicted outer membrane repeat protein